MFGMETGVFFFLKKTQINAKYYFFSGKTDHSGQEYLFRHKAQKRWRLIRGRTHIKLNT